MSRFRFALLLAALLPVGAGGFAVQAADGWRPVDLELVLAVDVSRSVDEQEFALQMQGYVQAFNNPRVVAAIRSGSMGAIAVTFVQWSGYSIFAQSVPWTVVSDEGSASRFASDIAEAARVIMGGGTSLSGAIDFSSRLFRGNGFDGARQVIDISGDGRNNNGRDPIYARDQAVAAGITINGLPILTDDPGLDNYYRLSVIGGPGAFVVAATNFDDFGRAILNKLLTEIAGSTPAEIVRQASRDGTPQPK